jgi:hypothetical protein
MLLLQVFRRKKWRYLILDEAHMIKNWKSQRWQTLLRFNSKRRLLITGTPLQVRSAGQRGCWWDPPRPCSHQHDLMVLCVLMQACAWPGAVTA